MTMPNKFAAPQHKTSYLAGALLASVVLNLFLVGIVAGVVPHVEKHRHFAPMALMSPHGEFLADEMTRYLSLSDATAFLDVVHVETPALQQARDNVHQATKGVADAFEQQPQDETTLQTALDHLSEAKAALDGVFKKIVQDASTKLSPDGRHRLAEMTM